MYTTQQLYARWYRYALYTYYVKCVNVTFACKGYIFPGKWVYLNCPNITIKQISTINLMYWAFDFFALFACMILIRSMSVVILLIKDSMLRYTHVHNPGLCHVSMFTHTRSRLLHLS